jgi:hypothetical protein
MRPVDFKVNANIEMDKEIEWLKDTGWRVQVSDLGKEAAEWLVKELPNEFKVREADEVEKDSAPVANVSNARDTAPPVS